PHGPERPAVDGQGRGAARRRAVVAAAGLEGPAHAAEEGQAVMPAEPQPFAPVEPPTPSPAPTAPEAPRRWFSVPRWREMLVCLLLAAATGAVYSRACRNGFVNYDDDVYVERNAHVRLGLPVENIRWAFTTTEMVNWHPLTWLSFALDARV